MKHLKPIIRPFVFTKESMVERFQHWLAEWLELLTIIIYLITFGYIDPAWKFTYLTYISRRKK